MKNTILLFCICLYAQGQAQEFNGQELKQLDGLGLVVENFDMSDQGIKSDFANILWLDKKRRKRKTLGTILTATSVIFSAMGVLSLAQEDPHAIAEIIGVLALGQGVLQGSATIPLFKSAKKQKKRRNKLIRKYNKEFEKQLKSK